MGQGICKKIGLLELLLEVIADGPHRPDEDAPPGSQRLLKVEQGFVAVVVRIVRCVRGPVRQGVAYKAWVKDGKGD